MGVFEQFPYTNFHDLNLDWVLKIVKATGKTIEELPQTVQDAVEKGLKDANLEQLVLDALTKYGLVINVKAPPEGLTPATGDGTADDTEAVQGCINYAAGNNGVVFFPAGAYLVSNLTIKDGVSLAGASRYGSRLVLRGGSVDPWFGGSFTECGFYNLTFDGNADIQINNVSIFRANVKDCQFSNVILTDGQYLLDLTGQGGHIQLDNIVFKSAVVMGMRIAGTSLVAANNLFFGSVSTLAGDCAFEVTANGGTYTGIVSTVTAPDLFINTGNNNIFQITNAVTTSYQDTGEGTQVNISGDITDIRNNAKFTGSFGISGDFAATGTEFEINSENPLKYKTPVAGKYFNTVPFKDANGSYNVLVENDNTQKLGSGDGVSVADYGAVGDGVTDDTAAITAAIADCPTGGKLVFPTGKYLSGEIALTRAINIDLRGSTLIAKDAKAISFTGIEKATTTLASAYTAADRGFTLSTAVSVGDLLIFSDRNNLFSTHRNYYYKGGVGVVLKVDGNTAYCDLVLPFDLAAGTIVTVYNPVRGASISNGTITAQTALVDGSVGIYAAECVSLRVENMLVENFRANYEFVYCDSTLVSCCYAGHSKNSGDTADGYGFDIASCNKTLLENCGAQSGQHGCATGGQEVNFGVVLLNCNFAAETNNLLSFDMHESTFDATAIGCKFSAFDVTNNFSAFNCNFPLSNDAELQPNTLEQFVNFRFDNCRFYGTRTVYVLRGDADDKISNIHISNCVAPAVASIASSLRGIENVIVENCKSCKAVAPGNCDNLVVTNCDFVSQVSHSGKVGKATYKNVNFAGVYNSLVLSCDDIVLENCTLESGTTPTINVAAVNCRVSNCDFSTSDRYTGFTVTSMDCANSKLLLNANMWATITNAWARNCSYGGTSDTVFSGCKIDGTFRTMSRNTDTGALTLT